LNSLTLKTFLMIVANGKAYTSGLQSEAVKQLMGLNLVCKTQDAFGTYIELTGLAIERSISILARETNEPARKITCDRKEVD
jgi:hypothetical protein